jgi:hypothetical protein
VTNGAFWAINHGKHKIQALRDLGAFERIIAFNKGTTSYNIAARIAHESGNGKPLDDFIQIVAPGKELLLLSDAIGGANAVALSPDILQIEEMTSRREVSVELPIGDTREYNDVVVTALVSNSDFVAENPEIVQAVVKGIQHALLLIHRSDPDVLRFARSYFYFANRAEGALSKAIKANVIPRHVSLARPHWLSAAKANCEASQNATWSATEEERALKYYDASVQPYTKFAEEAERLELPKAPPPPAPREWATFSQPLVITCAAIAITARWGWLAATIIATGMMTAWMLLRFFRYINIRRLRIAFLGLLWVLGIGIGILPFVDSAGVTNKELELLSLAVAFLIPAGWETINYADRSKK